MTGKDVKKLRKKYNMIRIDLAVKLRCAPATIWRWETKDAPIRPVYQEAIKRLIKKMEGE